MDFHNIKNKTNNILHNKTLLNGMLFSLFSFLNRGIMFLLMLVLANFITPDEFGYLSLFGTVVMVIGYFIAMSSDGYLSVAYFQDGKYGVQQTLSSIGFTSLIMGLLFLVVIVVGGARGAAFVHLPLKSLYIAVAICFFTVYTNLNLDYLRIKEKIKTYGIYSCVNALLNFVLSILFVKTFVLGWEGRIYAQVVSLGIFGIIGLLFFARQGFFVIPNKQYWKKILVWGIPMIPHVATNFIRQGCDRYIINYYHSIADVGLFSFALNLANILLMVGIGFNQSHSVDIYKILGSTDLSHEEKKKQLSIQKKQIFFIYTVSAALIFIGSVVFTPIILPKYSECISFLPLLTLSMYFNCLYFLYTNFLFYFSKTKWIMYTTVFSSLIHLLLSLLLTKYSLVITSAIYSLSNFLILLITYFLAKRIIKEKLN